MADSKPPIETNPVATPLPLDHASPTKDARGASDTGTQYQTPEEQSQAKRQSTGEPFPIIPGYEILAELGRGGMGVVYRAMQVNLDREVALKVMIPEVALEPRLRERFLREAKATASLENDHIVRVYDFGDASGRLFMAMELLRGESLHTLLGRTKSIPHRTIFRIAGQIAEGLAAAHKRDLVHRDLKPENIWLSKQERSGGTTYRVKLLDFGIVRPVQTERTTMSGGIVGTPAYMSPEQARGDDIDARSDLFSFGTVLYQMATGVLPFTGPNSLAVLFAIDRDDPKPPRSRSRDVPQGLNDVILQLLQKDPEKRPATAREAGELLRAAMSSGKSSPESAEESDDIPFAEPLKVRKPRSTRTIDLEDVVEWEEKPNTPRPEKTPRTETTRPGPTKTKPSTAERQRLEPAEREVKKPRTTREIPAKARTAMSLPAQRGGSTKWIVVLLLLAVLGGGGYWAYTYFTKKDGTKTNSKIELPATSLLPLMPPDIRDMTYENVEKIFAHPKFQPIYTKQFNQIERFPLRNAGLNVNDVRDMIYGNTESLESITAIRLKSAIDQTRAVGNATALRDGDFRYWRTPNGTYFAFPSDTIVLTTANEATIKKILARQNDKLALPEQLQELVKMVDDGDEWSVRSERAPGINPGLDKFSQAGLIASGNRIRISDRSLDTDTMYLFAASADAAARISEIKKNTESSQKVFDLIQPGKLSAAQLASLRQMMTAAKVEQNGTIVKIVASLNLEPFTSKELEDLGAGGLVPKP